MADPRDPIIACLIRGGWYVVDPDGEARPSAFLLWWDRLGLSSKELRQRKWRCFFGLDDDKKGPKKKVTGKTRLGLVKRASRRGNPVAEMKSGTNPTVTHLKSSTQ